MKKIVNLLLISAILATFVGCVHNNNKKPYQPSHLTTNSRRVFEA